MSYFVTLPQDYKEGDNIVFDNDNMTATVYNPAGVKTATMEINKSND